MSKYTTDDLDKAIKVWDSLREESGISFGHDRNERVNPGLYDPLALERHIGPVLRAIDIAALGVAKGTSDQDTSYILLKNLVSYAVGWDAKRSKSRFFIKGGYAVLIRRVIDKLGM